MKIITLCGSTRFRPAFDEWNTRLSLEGNVVLGIVPASSTPLSISDREMLNAIHLAKIDISDEIFVLNVDGYLGDDTKREIAYAEKAGKKIRYLFNGLG